MADFTAYLKIFVAVYVLVNPLEGIPLFLAHTASAARSLKQVGIAEYQYWRFHDSRRYNHFSYRAPNGTRTVA